MEAKIKDCEDVETFIQTQNNSKNIIISCDFNSVFDGSPCVLGVDEAGRGPVLGPMVYGVCYCVADKQDILKELGCADSKVLTEDKREEIFNGILKQTDYLGWMVEVISPNVICNQMKKRAKYSLNQIAQDSTVSLIKNVINQNINVTEVYIDTVGPPEKYQERLSAIFPTISITVAKKADSTYPIVSAASICAKVCRDRTIKGWKFNEGFKYPEDGFGSGYPNDPATKAYLTDNLDKVFGFPHLVRFSWSTADKYLEKAVPVEWDEDEAAEGPKTKRISSFFHKSPKSENQHTTKHSFFTSNNLSSAIDF